MITMQVVGASSDSPSAGTTLAVTDHVGVAGRYAVEVVVTCAGAAASSANVGVAVVRNENSTPDRTFTGLVTPQSGAIRFPALYIDLEAHHKIGVYAIAADSGVSYGVTILLHMVTERAP